MSLFKRAALGASCLGSCLLFGAFPTSPAVAQGARATSPPEFARRMEHLKPGEWVWAPDVPPSGPVMVYVDLSRQNGVG